MDVHKPEPGHGWRTSVPDTGPGRKLPPTWLLGLTTLCNGSFSGALIITIPQLLAARGVPEVQIAAITGASFIPGTFIFLLAPILDVGLSRKIYAVGLALMMAGFLVAALNSLSNLPLLAVEMFMANVAYYLFTPAVAGWFGQLVSRSDETVLGAWLAVGTVAGFGVMSALAIVLIRGVLNGLGIALICAFALSPLLIFPFVSEGAKPPLKLRDSFGPLWSSLAGVLSNRHILRMAFLFAAPAATFSLTNTLGGIGKDFHASEAFVGLIGGVGTTVGGIFGALVAPVLARRFPPLALYIGVGLAGALFTLALLIPKPTPFLFATAMIGENVFQSAAFALVNALVLLSIKKGSPIASTQFALLNAAVVIPITYMQFLDGKGYDLGGLAGSFSMDAGLSITACVILAGLFGFFWRETVNFETAHEPDAA
jgi:PAT family beta-lactamase induction signal transducer AmpG